LNGLGHNPLSFITFGKTLVFELLLLNALQASFAPTDFAIHGGVSVAVMLPAFSDGV